MSMNLVWRRKLKLDLRYKMKKYFKRLFNSNKETTPKESNTPAKNILEVKNTSHQAIFVDKEFPSGVKSLFKNGTSVESSRVKYVTHTTTTTTLVKTNVTLRVEEKRSDEEVPQTGLNEVTKWLRPYQLQCHEIFGNDFGAWVVRKSGRRRVEDVVQGRLNNSCLISCLAVLAPREDLLDNIVLSKERNNYGGYLIRLHNHGEILDIRIDDIFPCDGYRRLMFARSKRKELWVPLVEKAVAKLYKSYESLVDLDLTKSFLTLTGFPSQSLQLTIPDWNSAKAWKTLYSSYTSGFLICAKTHCEQEDKMVENESMGLIRGQSYSVLEIIEEYENRLLKLRNPWATKCWEGEWNNSCYKWTDALKRNFKPHLCELGTFFMSYEDFLKHFTLVVICRVRREQWKRLNFQGEFIKIQVYGLHVERANTELDIMLIFNSLEFKGKVKEGKVLVGILDENGKKVEIHAQGTIPSSVFLNLIVEHPGQYILAVVHSPVKNECSCNVNNNSKRQFSLVIHSSKKVECFKKEFQNCEEESELHENILHSLR